MPCRKCGLQYSSYCVDCVYVETGLKLSDEEYHEILKIRSEQEERHRTNTELSTGVVRLAYIAMISLNSEK